MYKSKKTLVVMGGTSSEREISIKSGNSVYEALKRKGYNVSPFILDENNAADILNLNPNLCVLVLHGKGGEDGTIQGMLELVGIRYTGSGVASSANCMNKILTKKILCFENISTPDFVIVNSLKDVQEQAKDIVNLLGLPVVVKAPCQGSSVGVEIVENEDDLINAIQNNIIYDGEILIEKFIKGTELTVPVMRDGDRIIALPIVEIVSENSFYDFESKYTEGMSHHIIPARISPAMEQKINDLAIKAYEALSCNGIARVDFFATEKNAFVIEINTIPGMTSTSLVPDSAKYAGISFDDLVEKIALNALDI